MALIRDSCLPSRSNNNMSSSLSLPHLQRRLRQLSLSSSPKSALFYSELYYAIFPPSSSSYEIQSHDGLHIYALALLANDEPYPALALVRDNADVDEDFDEDATDLDSTKDSTGCYACAVILARCAQKSARYSEGCAVLEKALQTLPPNCTPTGKSSFLEAPTDVQISPSYPIWKTRAC